MRCRKNQKRHCIVLDFFMENDAVVIRNFTFQVRYFRKIHHIASRKHIQKEKRVFEILYSFQKIISNKKKHLTIILIDYFDFSIKN